ncbi:MAG: Hpt domain-containing protein [Gammaproteobacteria bacterium]|nr:Hpt domain-containing protein [Gammaproteobacteria bacterium]
MSMAQEIDYSTLKWVKDEIDESLKQTRQALETFVENPDDKTQIRFCATYLHQIYGTLQMVEIYGGALLAEEMESLCNALLTDKIAQKDDAYDVLMRAILQLPSYLEHIERGESDQPVILLPLLNDLRSVRGDHLLSDNAFFAPNLSVEPPTEPVKEAKSTPDIKQYAKKLRTVYQASLVGIYRDNNTKGNLKKIGAVCRELMNLGGNENGKRLWWVATGLVEALLDGGLEMSNAVKQVIGQLDKYIKQVIENGEQAFTDSPTELLKNVLYYIATTKSKGKRVSQIKQAFKLDDLLPHSANIDEAYDTLRGSTQELMKTVSAVIKEDLLHVKDQLDIFVRSADRSATQLKPLEEQLRRIADTLAMLGLGDLRKIIQDQVHNIENMLASGESPSDIALMEIASSLLYIESSLEGIEASRFAADEAGESETVLPAAEQKQLNKLVIAESAEVLAKVKESFNTYAVDPTQFNLISHTPDHLGQVRGVLSMLSFDRAATLLHSATSYIANEIVQKQNQPNQAALDAIADVITSIEYYLEAIRDARLHPDSLLRVAEQSLTNLGYSITETEDAEEVASAAAQLAVPTNVVPETAPEAVPETKATEAPAESAASGEPYETTHRYETAEKYETTEKYEASTASNLPTESTAAEVPAPQDMQAQPAEAAAPAVAAEAGNVIASVKDQLVDDVDEEILEIFIEEADEVLVVMKENLALWEANTNDNDALTILRRSYHTIKGSGRLAGATVVGEFAWAIESMLNRVIDGKISTSPQLFAVMEQAHVGLEGLIKQLKGEAPTAADPRPIAEYADAIANGETIPAVINPLNQAAAEPAPAQEPVVQPVEEAITLAEIEEPEEEEPELELSIEDAPTEMIELVQVPAPESTLDEIFKKETAAHLANAKQFIEEFGESEHRFVTEPLMRALHTLHGSARMAEATHIAALSESLDRYFRTLHDSEQHVSDAALELLRQGVHAIDDMSAHADDNNYQPDNLSQLLEQAAELHKIAKAAQTVRESGSFSLHDEKADAELVSIFMEEAAEILGQIDTSLNRWHNAMDDLSIVDEVQRSLHTLKGGARMANIKPVADLSHGLETILEQVSEGRRTPNDELLDLTQKCYDQLAQALDHLYMGQAVAPASELLERLQQFAAELPAVAPGDETADEAFKPEVPPEVPFSELKTVELGALPGKSEQTQEFTFSERPTEKIVTAELDDELVGIFLEEADELHEDIENTLDHWRREPANLGYVSELQRNLHTLKGGARMAGITVIADLSHAVETMLERISEHQLTPNDSHPQLVQRCQDWLSETIAAVKNSLPLAPANQLMAELAQAASGQITETQVSETLDSTPATPETAPTQPVEPVEEISGEEITLEDVSDEEVTAEEIPGAEILQFESPATEAPESEPLEPVEFSVPEFKQSSPSASRATDSQAKTAEFSSGGPAEEYDEELVDIFLEEADEIQVNSEKTLHEWADDVDNRALISELQRALHTLKGGARMAGIKAIGDMSHSIESLLEAVTEGNLQPTMEFPRVVQLCHDWLSSAIEQVKQQAAIHPADHLLAQLDNLLAGKPAKHGVDEAAEYREEHAAEPPAAAPATAERTPESVPEELTGELVELPEGEYAIPNDIAERLGQTAPRIMDEQVRVRADLVDNLVNYASEANIYNARIEQQLNAWSFNLTELKQTVQRLREQLRKFEIETEAQIMYRHTEVSTENDQFDPLELDRFSYMQQLSRGMVESLGDLTSIEGLLESISSDADVLLLQQSRVNNDLQEGLMRTRMTPFSNVLPRLRRIVRQTCEETGKEAGLNVVGAEGEMDRTQLNRIVPALEHILRNAVDHGLESPDERRQSGKSPEGHIEVRFSHEGSEVVLRITDDGAGINIPALRQKAIERGLITQDTKISDNELTEFILQSGFSTATAVTQISGRGVGMDVVNTEIKQLNGSLHIETHQGQGSTFVIRLPLTVVVNQALMVNVQEAIYAIQMSNVEHVVRVRGDILNQLVAGELEQYDYAGYQYDTLNLGYILHGVKSPPLDPKATFPLLLGRSGEHRVALQVDELVGRQEIVIKSLGPQLSTLNNVSGATILPDGQVALILDLSTLIRSNMALQQLALSEEPGAQPPEVQHEVAKAPLVMIVDDSITVRKVTQRLLERHKFDTLTAKDGVDALTILLEQIPDIMLLDIEMPRMDGFELATAIRNDERLKHIPIIMITSRTGEKHRDRAMNIGVNMYLGKPFQEQELLDNIQSLLNNR